MSNQDLAIIKDSRDHSTNIVNIFPDKEEWSIMSLIAQTMEKTSFMPTGVNSAPEALAIILTGRELGIAPMTALRQIVMISGKPCIQGQLMIALMQRAGHRVDPIKQSPTEAIVEIQRKGEEKSFKFSFTMEEAQKAGLTNKKGDMYDKWSTDMLWWRAVARGCRTKGADVILGLRLPEELGAEVVYNEDGSTTVVVEQPQDKPYAKEVKAPELPKPAAKPVAKVKDARIENEELVVEAAVIPQPAPEPEPAAAEAPEAAEKANPYSQFDIEMELPVFDEWLKKLGTDKKDMVAAFSSFGVKNFNEVIAYFKKKAGIKYVARLILYCFIEVVKKSRPEYPWTWDGEYQEPSKLPATQE